MEHLTKNDLCEGRFLFTIWSFTMYHFFIHFVHTICFAVWVIYSFFHLFGHKYVRRV